MSTITYYQSIEFKGGAELLNPVIHPVATGASFPQGDLAFPGQMCFNETDASLYYCNSKSGSLANWIKLDAGGAASAVAADSEVTNPGINVRTGVAGALTTYYVSVKDIKNSNIDTNAAIAWSKLATGTANRLLYTDNTGEVKVSSFSVTTTTGDTGHLSMNDKRIVSLNDPKDDKDAVNYSTLKAWFSGNIDIHNPCYLATTGNINLSSPPSVFDGVTLTELNTVYRILVKDQTDPKQNGIYDWQKFSNHYGNPVVTMIRSTDEDEEGEIYPGSTTYVQFGSEWGSCGFVQNFTGSGAGGAVKVNTENQSWVQSYAVSKLIAGNGLSRLGNTLSVTGISGQITVSQNGVGLSEVTTTTTGSAGTNQATSISVDSYGRVTAITYSNISISLASQVSDTLPVANGGTGSTDGSITGTSDLKLLHGDNKTLFLHSNVGISTAFFSADTSLHVKVTGNSTTLGAKSNVLTLQNDSSTIGSGSEIVFRAGNNAADKYISIGSDVTSAGSGTMGRFYVAGKSTTGATSLTKYLTVEPSGQVTVPTGTQGLQINSGTSFLYAKTPDSNGSVIGVDGLGTNLSLKISTKGTGTVSLDSTGVGICTTTVSSNAHLTIADNSTTKALMILKGSALRTTPAAGALETEGTSLYWTNSSGTVTRRKLVFADFTNLENTAVLSVTNGGTGLNTLGLYQIPYGNGINAFGSVSAGTQGDVFMAGLNGLPGWVSTVPLKSGGTGADLKDGASKGAKHGIVYKDSDSTLAITAKASVDYAPFLGRSTDNAPLFASYSMPSSVTAHGIVYGSTGSSLGFLSPPANNAILLGAPSASISWLERTPDSILSVDNFGVIAWRGMLPFTLPVNSGGTGQTSIPDFRKSFTVPVGKKYKFSDWSISNDYTLTHNLGTDDVIVGVWVSDNGTAGSYKRAEVGITTNTNSITLSSAAPLSGKHIKVCILGMEWS